MRLRSFLAASAALLLLGACSLMPWSRSGSPVPTLADSSRIVPGETATVDAASDDAAATTDLDVAWVADVDQRKPMSPAGTSRPVIVGNRIVIGGRDGRVRIYDMQGSELRRIALEAPCESGAAVLGNGLIVLGDVHGMLYGIDPKQGKVVWHHQLSSVLLGHPVPLADGDFLMQTSDNRVYRFSPSGEKRWSYAGHAAGLGMDKSPSPIISGGQVYVVFGNGDVAALKLDDGALIWRRELILSSDAVVLSELRVPVADPVLVGNVLLVPIYQGNLIALSAVDGQQLWSRNLSLRSSPLAANGQVYVSTAAGDVLALDPKSGASLWRQKVGSAELVGPVLSGGRLIVGDAAGKVFALDMNGRKLASAELLGRVDYAPVAVPDGTLVRTSRGALYLIR